MSLSTQQRDKLINRGLNPIGEEMDVICRPTIEAIANSIDDTTLESDAEPYNFEFLGFNSFERDDDDSSGSGDGFKPCTNERTAQVDVTWLHTDGTLDLRKPLPAQVAEWLRAQAKRMTDAAEAVEAVEDTRNLNRIVAIVGKAAGSESETGLDSNGN